MDIDPMKWRIQITDSIRCGGCAEPIISYVPSGTQSTTELIFEAVKDHLKNCNRAQQILDMI